MVLSKILLHVGYRTKAAKTAKAAQQTPIICLIHTSHDDIVRLVSDLPCVKAENTRSHAVY